MCSKKRNCIKKKKLFQCHFYTILMSEAKLEEKCQEFLMKSPPSRETRNSSSFTSLELAFIKFHLKKTFVLNLDLKAARLKKHLFFIFKDIFVN